MTNTKKLNKYRGTLPRSQRDLLERLDLLDLQVSSTGSGHLRVTTVAGKTVGMLPSTPSCPRNLLNTIRDLKHNGVDIRAMKVT